MSVLRCLRSVLIASCGLIGLGAPSAAEPAPKIIARIDLSKPFHLPPGATLTATQGGPVENAIYQGDTEPGIVHLCIQVRPSSPCIPDLDDMLRLGREPDLFSTIHFLHVAKVVYPRGRARTPLLYVGVGSLLSGDGDQLRVVEMLAYRLGEHKFGVALRQLVGTNNNQEVRYMQFGPLKGSVVVADSPYGPPFTYVVTVYRLTDEYRYKQALRYRSATVYGDGNPLAVIDSEMPNILRRLRLWQPDQPLPLPKSGCAKPRLVKSELWCS